MKQIALAICAAVVLVAGMTSCLVDRVTSDFACADQSDCDADRVCQEGYCIKPTCPSTCPECSFATMSCPIVCNNPNKCGDNVVCPEGFNCVITCSASGACDAINCTEAASCDIACSTSNACGDIQCGDGACNVECTATNACADVACGDSCKCDVSCPAGNCDANSCPMADTCTADGTTDTTCRSNRAGCNSCI